MPKKIVPALRERAIRLEHRAEYRSTAKAIAALRVRKESARSRAPEGLLGRKTMTALVAPRMPTSHGVR